MKKEYANKGIPWWKREMMRAASELGYPAEVLQKLSASESETKASNIMHDARLRE